MGCYGTDDDRCPYIERSFEIWVFKGAPVANSHSLPYHYSDSKVNCSLCLLGHGYEMPVHKLHHHGVLNVLYLNGSLRGIFL